MKQILVGTFQLGYENCDLYAREGTGGEFYFIPDKTSVSRIKIGMDYKRQWEIIHVLLHEAFEFSLARHEHRFVPCGKFNDDSAHYLFAFDHPQFATCVAEVAEFVAYAWPLLHKAWKKWGKPVKKKRRKQGKRPH